MTSMILMCGKCGSGKTYYAKKLAEKNGYRYLGIDECYAILNGDDRIRENKFEAWQLFYKRIHICETLGQSVVVDTNAPLPCDRNEFLNWFPNFNNHTLVWVDADDETCWIHNSSRDRMIPRKHFESVNHMFTPPTIGESKGSRTNWNEIIKVINNNEPDINKWEIKKYETV